MASNTWYERLSPTDATFLYVEDSKSHMHVGGVFVYQGRPPPFRDFAAFVASRLDRVPRYRQRLAFVPLGLGRPVWVDDARFDIENHVRHSALPEPGGEEALKRLAGRLFGQPLDPEKPLWELEMVEGVGEDRFAIITKTHHCLLDGIAGNDFIKAITDPVPSFNVTGFVPSWMPRPAPHPVSLLAASVRDQILAPVRMAREAMQTSTEARRMLRELNESWRPLLRLARKGRAPITSLNQSIGRQRRYEFLELEMAAVKQVRDGLGATVNDVLLAVVTGALRELLTARGDRLRDDLRVFVPVNARPPGAGNTPGNQVGAIFCPLPLTEADPVARVRKVAAAMNELKRGKEALATVSIARLGEFMLPIVATGVARTETAYRRFNLVVSNVPGSRTPLYFLGRRLLSFHPLIPLSTNQTLSVGLHSYTGTIGFGLLADADRGHDLPLFARAIKDSMDELVRATRPAIATQQQAVGLLESTGVRPEAVTVPAAARDVARSAS
jgi:diacylglycerol O-acyltransferase / wax synthase